MPVQPLSETQRHELRRDLLVLADILRRQLELSEESVKPVSLDEPIGRISRVDAMQQQAMAKAGRGAALVRYQQVEAALQRCKDNEYGLCAQCEEDIGYGRLKARQEARLCIRCQNELERPD